MRGVRRRLRNIPYISHIHDRRIRRMRSLQRTQTPPTQYKMFGHARIGSVRCSERAAQRARGSARAALLPCLLRATRMTYPAKHSTHGGAPRVGRCARWSASAERAADGGASHAERAPASAAGQAPRVRCARAGALHTTHAMQGSSSAAFRRVVGAGAPEEDEGGADVRGSVDCERAGERAARRW